MKKVLELGFFAHDRFEVIAKLGDGGMGVVYSAYDKERQEKVALKTLRTADPQALYRLRNEFSALQGLHHKNLVSYGELFESDGQWYFTMELVEGVDFVDYVVRSDSIDEEENASGSYVFDESRLREVFRQLAEGLSVLHETGRVHRDVKPSNVLVDKTGRVVIMDFGIALKLDAAGYLGDHSCPVGTAGYMAPEQVSSEKVGPGADWYSVGVMLYEALTGRLPFRGTECEMIKAKHSEDPQRPRKVNPQVPEDLDELCMRLLHRNPAARPDAAACLSVLNNYGLDRRELDAALCKTRMPVFAGRFRELEYLNGMYKESAGGVVAVLVHGESGIGKSELLKEFIQRVRSETGNPAVLFGRCGRRDPIVFNGFYGVLKDLALFLKKTSDKKVRPLLPQDTSLLLKVFPILSGVAFLEPEKSLQQVSKDDQMVRTLAFDALRRLFAILAENGRVLLIIDDFQWADRDTIRLLRALFQPPDTPSICLVLSISAVEDKLSEEVERVRRIIPIQSTEMKIGPLPVDVAVEAAQMLLTGGTREKKTAERIGVLSGGRPLMLQQLVRWAEERPDGVGGQTLEDVLESRTAGLETKTRDLLELICISGTPLNGHTAAAVVEQDNEKTLRRIARLRWMDLLKNGGEPGEDLFEPYHERVGEWVVSRMDPEERALLHRNVFRALNAAGGGSPEILARHLEGAGDLHRSATFYMEAARKASRLFAFDRAAGLYIKALKNLNPPEKKDDVDEMRRLFIKSAESLAMAGRGVEAAAAYLEAVKGANAAEQLRLEHLAASQLLMSGKLDQGLEVIGRVTGRLGLKLPRTPLGSVVSLLFRRFHIRIRGLGFKLKDPSQISPEKLENVDLWRSLALGLGVSDNMRATDFNTRWVMKALEVGEPDRVMQALAAELVFVASMGKRKTKYFLRLKRTIEKLLEKYGSDIAKTYLAGGMGYGAFMAGEWRTSLEAFEEAEFLMSSRASDFYEMATAYFPILWCQFYLGDLKAMTKRLTGLVHMAMDRGDIFSASGMFLGLANLAYLNRDGPDAARREVDDMIGFWSTKGYHLQHYWALLARVHIALFNGSGVEARKLVETDWPLLKKSMLLHIPSVKNEGLHLRGRVIVAATPHSALSERKGMLLQVEKMVRILSRKNPPWIRALSLLLDGAVWCQRENQELAKERLEAAVAALDSQEMGLYAAAARWRLADIIGGDSGEELRREAVEFMTRQKVNNMEGMVNLLAPGFS